MTDLIAAIIQGVVEGLTEFLPVSSTAHILITQELLSIDRTDSFWKMFAVFIQLGAILAVVAYFWKRLMGFVASFLQALSAKDRQPGGKSIWLSHPLPLVMISFVVTAIPCFLIDKLIDDNMESLLFIGIALVVGGIAMFVIDRYASNRVTTTQLEEISLKQAIVIGLAQIVAAVFPGTSRSMSTIAGGQLMGLSRSAALEFSFFLSIPIMFAASGFKLLKYLMKQPLPEVDRWIALSAGFATSFIVAFFVIAWFMQWVRTRGFAPFALYRVIAGAALIGWVLWNPA
ncbi:MAG: undecaprenyl-diphosphate phosphatase [Pirellula sp.]